MQHDSCQLIQANVRQGPFSDQQALFCILSGGQMPLPHIMT